MTHYYSPKQNSPLIISTLNATLCKHTFLFFTAPGVFSKSAIDAGTTLLIEDFFERENKIQKKENEQKQKTLLDLGCGYGPVGVAIAFCFPHIAVTMSDVNERAVHLAKANAARNNAIVHIIESDVFSHISHTFDTILLNPPQSAGKKLCFRMIEESYDHLTKNGRLIIVARHNKGGKELAKKMEQVFGNVTEGKKHAGYRIYESKKESLR